MQKVFNSQQRRVFDAMIDGKWRTLAEIEAITMDPQASVSARLRDFRKAEYGEYIVHRRWRGVEKNGVNEYKLVDPRKDLPGLDLYGGGPGVPVILVNPADVERIDAKNWHACAVVCDPDIPQGTALLGKAHGLSCAEYSVDDMDPTLVHVKITFATFTQGQAAKIGEHGGLVFTFVSDAAE